MLLHLTDKSDESLQGQIVRQLRARILSGRLVSDEALPSIRGLARQQKVSVITVQRAYEVLERDGLVRSRRGKGFYVEELAPQQKHDMAEGQLTRALEGPLRVARAEGLSPAQIARAIELMMKRGES